MRWEFELLQKGLVVDSDGRGQLQVRWRPSTTGKFTTHSAYTFLDEDDRQREEFNWPQLWRLRGPPRGSMLLCMACGTRAVEDKRIVVEETNIGLPRM